ncbi:MAG TPA: class I SAM-dependent methyltransferase [Candidatus Aquilonibacter sp.]|nr:class I SAM-dependent methyltransferase [Candidatus Aquilonibacter sp.]
MRVFRRETNREWYLARCSACKQHFTDPQPTLDDIVSFYGDGYHEELLTVELTRAAFGPKFESYINWIAPHLRPGGRTLDVGCSTGLFPCLLKERGFAAEGLELNSVTAAFGRKEFGIPITNQPFETANYAASSFSLVSMTDVLEHSLSPIATLERVHSILESGGHALITFPDISSVESQYFHACARMTGREWLWQNCHVPLHTWEFTRPTAEALFRRTGFRVSAFRRSHVVLEEKRERLLALLYLPSRLLTLRPLSRLMGTQLEFLIQKQ